MVYARGRHYENVDELRVAIEEAWSTVGSDLLLRLYKSLPRRMHAVMDACSSATKYQSLFYILCYMEFRVFMAIAHGFYR